MSVVTSVLAFFLNAVFGSRIAPIKSHDLATASRKWGYCLSSVPRDVTNATRPPGRTRSAAATKK